MEFFGNGETTTIFHTYEDMCICDLFSLKNYISNNTYSHK